MEASLLQALGRVADILEAGEALLEMEALLACHGSDHLGGDRRGDHGELVCEPGRGGLEAVRQGKQQG